MCANFEEGVELLDAWLKVEGGGVYWWKKNVFEEGGEGGEVEEGRGDGEGEATGEERTLGTSCSL